MKKSQQNMHIPTYLKNNIKNFAEKHFSTMTLCSSAGNDWLEVWYYGNLFKVPNKEKIYIDDSDSAPIKVIAKDPKTNEEILIFDGAIHGYDNMFCYTYTKEQIDNRPLKKLEIPASQLILELGYNIDYEDDDFDYNENGNVILIDESTMSWEDVLCNAFDYLALSYVNKNGKNVQFVDRELA